VHQLRFMSGAMQGEVIDLPEARITLGRDPDNAICTDNDAVSQHHAVLAPETGGFTLCDLDSSNGTFVNGEPIKERRLLHGDVIRIGILELRYELDGVAVPAQEGIAKPMRVKLPPVKPSLPPAAPTPAPRPGKPPVVPVVVAPAAAETTVRKKPIVQQIKPVEPPVAPTPAPPPSLPPPHAPSTAASPMQREQMRDPGLRFEISDSTGAE